MGSVFISYSHTDKNDADQIAAILDGLGVQYFRDEKDIEWGDKITASVKDGLKSASAVVVIISPGSLKSHWVSYEVGYATALDTRLLPYLTHPAIDLPGFVADLRYAKDLDQVTEYFTDWNQTEADPQTDKPGPQPDVRVRYSPALTKNHFGGVTTLVAFAIENHDSQPVFMNSVSLLVDDDRRMQIIQDSITGAKVSRTLQPGQKMDVYITREVFDSDSIRPENVTGVIATDEIGRQFHGDPNGLQECIAELFQAAETSDDSSSYIKGEPKDFARSKRVHELSNSPLIARWSWERQPASTALRHDYEFYIELHNESNEAIEDWKIEWWFPKRLLEFPSQTSDETYKATVFTGFS